MSLESTPSVSSAASAQPARRHAGRRADGGAAAESPFAQLLQGQQQAADALAAPQPAASSDARRDPAAGKDDDEPAASQEGQGDASKPASRLPRKDQLSAEDLPVTPLNLPGTAGDTLGRLLNAQRAQARQAALGAERGRETRQHLGQRAESDGAAALAVSPFADALARAGAKETAQAADLAAPPVGAGGALAAAAVPVAGAEAVLPSLAAPGDLPVASAPAPAPDPAPVPDAYATLAPTPGTEAFPAALGAQLSTWVSEGVEHARLELNPRELGPIEVHIALRDGATRIELGSDVASTRDALNQALPQLAQALGDVGLALAGGQVSDQSSGQRPPDGGDAQSQARQAGAWLRGGSATESAVSSAGLLPRPPVNPRALLDLYA